MTSKDLSLLTVNSINIGYGLMDQEKLYGDTAIPLQ